MFVSEELLAGKLEKAVKKTNCKWAYSGIDQLQMYK